MESALDYCNSNWCFELTDRNIHNIVGWPRGQRIHKSLIDDNYDNDSLLDYGSRLQAGLVQHIYTYNKI